MKRNINSIVGVASLIAIVAIGAGCAGCRPGNSAPPPARFVTITNTAILQAKIAALTNRVGELQAEKTVLTSDGANKDKEMEILTKSNIALTEKVDELKAKLTNSTPRTARANAATPTTLSQGASSGDVTLVPDDDTKITAKLPQFNTNGVATGGLPCLFKNSDNTAIRVTVIVSEEKSQKFNFCLPSKEELKLDFPPGEYGCVWTVGTNTTVYPSAGAHKFSVKKEAVNYDRDSGKSHAIVLNFGPKPSRP